MADGFGGGFADTGMETAADAGADFAAETGVESGMGDAPDGGRLSGEEIASAFDEGGSYDE